MDQAKAKGEMYVNVLPVMPGRRSCHSFGRSSDSSRSYERGSIGGVKPYPFCMHHSNP